MGIAENEVIGRRIPSCIRDIELRSLEPLGGSRAAANAEADGEKGNI
ncbi:MAG: hypothetical protein Ct9H300mP11_06210 [Chloroflexota bacterium]|nr:MAG: hypothetical protein Ct9H300mP11_06210 [Chloroflexota bacterium]